jgi:hypothetical protein
MTIAAPKLWNGRTIYIGVCLLLVKICKLSLVVAKCADVYAKCGGATIIAAYIAGVKNI